jgi:F0F1-type ATP synthase assembly protein I
MGYIVGYALVGAFLVGVLVGFGVGKIIDKE